MYLPDPIELGEMRAEEWERRLNCRNDEVDCGWCGKRIKLGDAQSASADPWSEPICQTCADPDSQL